MPLSPPSPCTHPGCPALCRTPRCPEHTKQQNAARQDDDAYRLRGSGRWKRFRDWHKGKYPLCCDPFKIHGELPPATAHTHHVIPVSERPELLCYESNARSLCVECHARIEGMERNGKRTRELFGE